MSRCLFDLSHNNASGLSYIVHIFSKFMQSFLDAHCLIDNKPLRWFDILLRWDSDLTITAYCNSDWAACPRTQRSLYAFFVYFGDSPISWKPKKQDTVSYSSAEVEYRSVACTLWEPKWLKELLQKISFFTFSSYATLLWQLSCSPHRYELYERIKHTEFDCNQVRDAVQEGLIAKYILEKEQVTDLFTKTQLRTQFEKLMSKLGIRNFGPLT